MYCSATVLPYALIKYIYMYGLDIEISNNEGKINKLPSILSGVYPKLLAVLLK